MRIRTLLLAAATFALLYFAIGAYLLRFALEPLMLPRVAVSTDMNAPLLLRISGDDGSAMLVRRYGTPRVGCVVFFPGQHGLISEYERSLFPAFSAQGVAVLAVAYPGQDGAPGTPHLPEVLALASKVIAYAQATCPDHRVVVYGRSLGAMVAAYVAGKSHPAGLILESAAPSLSSAIRLRLNARWCLAPLDLLPISKLLTHDYSLAEALPNTPAVRAVVFQGTADSETPLSVLQAAGLPANFRLIAVSGGTHSTTYMLARDRLVEAALSMFRD
jgi:pimeloyl-ACP methyl ester carboxylesterase